MGHHAYTDTALDAAGREVARFDRVEVKHPNLACRGMVMTLKWSRVSGWNAEVRDDATGLTHRVEVKFLLTQGKGEK